METRGRKTWNKKSVITGVAILLIGLVWLLRKAGVQMPYWLFSWETLLIAIGLIIGIDNKFKNPASYILIIIGSFFLLDDFIIFPVRLIEFFWPILFMVVGVIVILQARKGNNWLKKKALANSASASGSSNGISSISIFNGVKKQITSKNFNGGEIVNIFGGTELSFMQADFEGTAHLEVTVIFGGAKLIIPKNWEVRTEVTPIFGGVDDKRHSAVEVLPDEKILVITGTVLFGGLDIVNY